MKRTLAAAALALALGAGMAQAAGTDGPLRYREVNGNGPRVVIRGSGCLQAEDSTRLRLVEWTGADGKAVYRCVTP